MLTGREQRIQIGDATTVFWAERPSFRLEEDIFSHLFYPNGKINDNPNDESSSVRDPETTRLVHDILSRMREGKQITGAMQGVNTETRFFILGLSPNASRISIRFWHNDTFGDYVKQIGQHFKDLSLVRSNTQYDPEFIPVPRILLETAPLRDKNRIPPLLGGALMQSILTGSCYPQSLYTAILSRIRNDHNVNYVRVSVIKACLARRARIFNNMNGKEILAMSLNEQATSKAYRLGRLFALLEKAQQDAVPNSNATIKDRYFGAASATPGAVFPILLRLAQHHISKAEYGFSTDKKIEEVISGIDTFPAHLNLEDQGVFVLGYYHQRQAIYQKSEKKEG
jgi:CRISPR-associated protein Csd1